MSLIVEDGTGLANANAYIDIVYFDNYLATYGLTSTATTVEKNLAIINASKSVDLLYGPKYQSYPLKYTQSLLYPRTFTLFNGVYLIPSNVIPTQLKDAVCEITLLKLNGTDVFPEPNTDRNIQSKTDKLGELSTSISYFSAIPKVEFNGFNKIELLLKPILVSTKKRSTLCL